MTMDHVFLQVDQFTGFLMQKFIFAAISFLFATVAHAGGISAPTALDNPAIDETMQHLWTFELEVGRAEISAKNNFVSATEYTNGCTNASCNEDLSDLTYALAVFWQYDARFSFGLRYQSLDNIYHLTSIANEIMRQDVNLFTLAARRHFRDGKNLRPFFEIGLGRYSSTVSYRGDDLEIDGSGSGWTPIVGAGAIINLNGRWSVVSSIRQIRSAGNRSGILGNNPISIEPLDEPINQLSIGLRFEI